jgi:putative nucleotidyltransferase with HDIG domain
MASRDRCEREVAKRAGLLHDIGKAETTRSRPTYQIGADLAKKIQENADVINAIAAKS